MRLRGAGMAVDKDWEDYLYVKINLYICREIYNKLKPGNKLHNSFESDVQKSNSNKRKKSHMTFEYAMDLGAENSNHIRRIFKSNGKSRLSDDDILKLTDRLAISEEYFKAGTKKMLEVPGLSIEDWKFFFNSKYKNNIPNVSRIGRSVGTINDKIADLVKSNIFANYGSETEIYHIFWYYYKGEKYKGESVADKVKRIFEELHNLNYNDWIVCRKNWNEYIEVMNEQITLIKSIDVLEKHIKKFSNKGIEIKKV